MPRMRSIENEVVESEQSQPYQFHFDITEANAANEQIATDAEVTTSNIDLQQQDLTADQLQQLFNRASSQLVTESTNEQEFVAHAATMQAPRKGQIVQIPFPPFLEDRKETLDVNIEQLKQIAQQEAGPLIIERFSPSQTEIDYPLTNVTITFNQPMIFVPSFDENVNVEDFGVTLTPKLDGRWRWIGTKTIQFESKHRLPYSTKYQLRVNKERCQSAIGGKLDNGFQFEFSTTTPKVVDFKPHGTVPTLKPKYFLLFDQNIDKNQILKHLRIVENNQKEILHNDLQLLDEAEAQKEFKWNIAANEGNNDRYVAFTFKDNLSKATKYTVGFLVGCPQSMSDWSASFETYKPLRIVDWYPNLKRDDGRSVYPGQGWSIVFNNSLDRSTVTKALFNIVPKITVLSIRLFSHDTKRIIIYNNSKANTVYTLRIEPSVIKDNHGQALEHDFCKQPIQFRVHDSLPLRGCLFGTTGMVVMDPAVLNDPFYSFVVKNYSELNVRIHRVKSQHYSRDLPCFNLYASRFDNESSDASTHLPGENLVNRVLQTNCEADTPKAISIPLKSYLTKESGVGQLIVLVQPTEKAWNTYQHNRWDRKPVLSAWLQCTRLSVDAFLSFSNDMKMTVWVTELMTGKPVNQAAVTFLKQKNHTNDQGLCTLENFHTADDNGKIPLIIVENNDDQYILTDDYFHDSKSNQYVWHVVNDRGLYKPKEEVHVKGYVRILEVKGDAKLPSYVAGTVEYIVHDSCDQQLEQSTVQLNPYGAFDIKFTLPENVNLGKGWIGFNLTDKQSQARHVFRIQEFRRAEYQVSSSIRPVSAHYSHPTNEEHVIASCQGTLFAGGYLNDADVQWTVKAETTTFTPPNRSEYIFGRGQPFFRWFDDRDKGQTVHLEKRFQVMPQIDSKIRIRSLFRFKGKTNDQGEHGIRITYSGLEKKSRPIVVSALAVITDLNNQTQEIKTQFLIHSSTYYVGFQLETNYGKKDQPMEAKVIVADVDGNLIDNVLIECQVVGVVVKSIEEDIALLVYEEVKDEKKLTAKSSKRNAVSIHFTPRLAGRYHLTFTVKDEQGRLSMSLYKNLLVLGGEGTQIKRRTVEFVPIYPLTVIPNASSYQVDETCELLISVPFSPAKGLLLLDCEGQVSEPIQFQVEPDQDSTTVRFQISKDWIPGFTAHVELTGSCARETELSNWPNRPAIAVHSAAIEVSRDIYKLNVSVNTKDSIKTFTPSSTVRIDVGIRQFTDNKSVGEVEVCLVVVDEAILSLTGHQLTSPLEIFYPKRTAAVKRLHGRSRCLLFNNHHLEDFEKNLQKNQMMLGFPCALLSANVGDHSDQHQPIVVRSNFNPLACWIPSSITDSSGHVSFEFKLPENLTRYRISVIAANDKQYGLGEMSLTVELPVMIRPSPPRFFNYGDIANLAVILQNQTNSSLSLHTGLKATNAKLLKSQNNEQATGYAIQLPANKRAAVTFPLSTVHSGTARFQFIVSSVSDQSQISFGDAIELSVPVFAPAASEAFATYGDVAKEEVVLQPIKKPENVIPQFGQLSVTTSSTVLASLTDAVLALYNYPYECTEQLSSRLLGVQSLWDVLRTLKPKDLPSMPAMQTKFQSDINKLKNRQYENGGFGYWTNRSDSHADPFITVHTAHCLVILAQKKIFDVDTSMLDGALQYLANIQWEIAHLSSSKYWFKTTRFSLISYALYVRAKHQQNVANEAVQLFTQTGFEKLSLEALGWLLIALSTDKNNHCATPVIKTVYQHLKGKVSETAETANFITSYGDDGQLVMLYSAQRTDAVLLEALLTIDHQSTLCTKLCKGLQAHRLKGAWKSTQENCFVLIALNKYFHIKEMDAPNFSASVWLDEDYYGQHQYRGRTTDTQTVNIPMKVILSNANNTKNLIIQKQGRGRLYYRIALNWAPTNLELNAVNYGFQVKRTYISIDDFGDIHRQADGTWKFKLGAKIQVILTMITTQRRYHIALVDYLPAGCEPLNTQLKGTLTGHTEISMVRSKYDYYHGWTDHENLRDERAEAFRSLLWPGVYQWSYVMRATSAGIFIVPAAKAEEMYSPEVFGRSATEKVVID